MSNKAGQPQEEATLGKIDKITATVFISDVHAIINPERRNRIRELKIKHILTASHRNMAAKQPLPGVKHEYLCMRDTLDENLLATGLLERGLKIIDEADSRNGRILVGVSLRCISRSVTLVCAHLMKKHKWSMEEALARIREKRPAAVSNPSFIRQLKIFEECNYNAEPSTIVKSSAYLESAPELWPPGTETPK